MQIVSPHFRLTESEILGMEPHKLFDQVLQVEPLSIQVWESQLLVMRILEYIWVGKWQDQI